MLWGWREEKLPGDPEANMDADRVLLAALTGGEAQIPTIRLYRWNGPTVSYGRLQEESDIEALYPNLPRVRRPTGGRAVLHGTDLTITVAVLASQLQRSGGQGVQASYRTIAAPVVETFRAAGIKADYGTRRGLSGANSTVNCFDLAERSDLIDTGTGRKILGCAQRREGNAILQQMSLPLDGLPPLETLVRLLKNAYQTGFQIEGWQVI